MRRDTKLYQFLKTCAAMIGLPTRRGQTRGWERFARGSEGVDQLPATATNDMERAFYSHNDRLAHKWHNYLSVYDRHSNRFRATARTFLEIGVCHGGSLQIWKRYLGGGARVHGIDILEICSVVEEPGIQVHVCDTANRASIIGVLEKIGPLDIVVDDGSHLGDHQRRCFEEIFPRMREGGVYMVEDVQCSYWREFGGGYRQRGTFVEYAKDLIDRMHVWYISDERIDSDEWFARNIRSINFYDGMIVIEKGPKPDPFHIRVGHRTIPVEPEVTKLIAEGRWLKS